MYHEFYGLSQNVLFLLQEIHYIRNVYDVVNTYNPQGLASHRANGASARVLS